MSAPLPHPNPPLETIPSHLLEYITEQNSSLYSSIDQAVWRYVMRVSKEFFSTHGHPLYAQGLGVTGMSTESIPKIETMDQALRKLGWRAVAINGFIPPAIFLEFQSLRILAIACDIRKLENLGYTPSPDIIHEAAGHAPIVADPGYRAYLEAYGEVARNAIISKYDVELYDAILKLSELKEDPHTGPGEIETAQKHFELIASQESTPSEVALLTRMAWWTTEYGLIEKNGTPVVYGAGLLSSVSESYNCLKPNVLKIPFSLEATIKTSYDITRPQPQLFVAKSFDELTEALEKFADTMAYRKGGAFGLQAAKTADNTVTLVFENGLQVSGIVSDFQVNEEGEETSVTITGNKQISFHDHASDELLNHLLGQKIMVPLFDKSVVSSNLSDLQRKLHGSGLHTKEGNRILGRFKKELNLGTHGKILLLEQVKILGPAGETIFEERMKVYPLFLATKIISVFGGAADRTQYALKNASRVKKVSSHKSNLTTETTTLNELYQRVREFREHGHTSTRILDPILHELNGAYPNDWLLRVELLEIFEKHNPNSIFAAQLREHLKSLGLKFPLLSDMIARGVNLIQQGASS